MIEKKTRIYAGADWLREHLESHITDGKWHDQCPYCLKRRRFGGTGVENRDEATGEETR